jgi:cyclophilin family peptidyl-prolyl cis-trans isomerase
MNRQLATNLFFAFVLLAMMYGLVYTFFIKAKNQPLSAIPDVSLVQNNATTSSIETSLVTESTTTTATTTAVKKNKQHMITIQTNLGAIIIETFDNDAPKTVENFKTLANKGYYNGLIFHRVIKGFMIQGGDPTGTGMGGPGYKFADELNPVTASYKNGYKKGVVAMANSGPNTNGSQFFIMLADTPLPNNYSIFGHVVSGQDVVDAIGKLPTGSNDRPINPPVMKIITAQ